MQEINKLIGKYYFIEQGTENFSNEFILEIYEEDIKLVFRLEMIVNGNFGKIGKTWFGMCVDRDDFVSLIAEKEIDWTFTVMDNKKTENSKSIFEVLPLEVLYNQTNIVIHIIKVHKKIKLIKQ